MPRLCVTLMNRLLVVIWAKTLWIIVVVGLLSTIPLLVLCPHFNGRWLPVTYPPVPLHRLWATLLVTPLSQNRPMPTTPCSVKCLVVALLKLLLVQNIPMLQLLSPVLPITVRSTPCLTWPDPYVMMVRNPFPLVLCTTRRK